MYIIIIYLNPSISSTQHIDNPKPQPYSTITNEISTTHLIRECCESFYYYIWTKNVCVCGWL